MERYVFVAMQCHRCREFVPYDGCPHDCPVANEEEDEGFVEDPLLITSYIVEVHRNQNDPWVQVYIWETLG